MSNTGISKIIITAETDDGVLDFIVVRDNGKRDEYYFYSNYPNEIYRFKKLVDAGATNNLAYGKLMATYRNQIKNKSDAFKDDLQERIDVLFETTYKDLVKKQSDITKLFPTFHDRVKQIASSGAAELTSTKGNDWHFKVGSVSDPSKKYHVHVKWKDYKGEIEDKINDPKFQKKAGGANATKLAKHLIYDADIEVSCSCLTGDTKIHLLDGRILTIEEINKEFGSRKEFWVYSSDENGDFIPAKAMCLGVTGKTNTIIEVTLDNNKKIKTTDNHLYRMRDGTYREAKNLSIGDSLMPLYLEEQKQNSTYSQRYLKVKLNSKTGKDGRPIWKMIHRIVAEKILKKDMLTKIDECKKLKTFDVVHHKNFKTFDNRPENLQWMEKTEHFKYHAFCARKDRIHVIKAYKEKWKNDKEFVKKQTEVNRQNGKNFQEKARKNPELLRNFIDAGKKWSKSEENRKRFGELWKKPEMIEKRKSIEHINKIKNIWKDKERLKKHSATLKKTWTNERRCKQRQRMILMNKTICRNENGFNNHKIINIKRINLNKQIPVYDLTVEKYQNFALEAGIFVHNCPASRFWGPNYTLTQLDAKKGREENRPPVVRNPKEHGTLCKHAQYVFNLLPFYISDMAHKLKESDLSEAYEEPNRTALKGISKSNFSTQFRNFMFQDWLDTEKNIQLSDYYKLPPEKRKALNDEFSIAFKQAESVEIA